MTEEQQQQQQEDENKRIRPRERARGQKMLKVSSTQLKNAPEEKIYNSSPSETLSSELPT